MPDTLLMIFFLLAGFGILVLGGELLIRGATAIAATIGMPPMIIGLTIVAFGTSAPELAVSLNASFQGQADISLGNIVGSNICNILLILGVAGLITPLVVDAKLVRANASVMVAAALALLIMSIDGHISQLDGFILFMGIIGYTLFIIKQMRATPGVALIDEDDIAPAAQSRKELYINIGLFVAGSLLLVAGAHLIVKGAIIAAEALGASELVISLTVVALGTSLPELAASVMAGLKGQRDIAVGNVIGSNIMNILLVLGLTSLVSSHGIQVAPIASAVDIPLMVIITLLCFAILWIYNCFTHPFSMIFLGYYGLYIGYLAARSIDANTGLILLQIAAFMLTTVTVGLIMIQVWQQKGIKR